MAESLKSKLRIFLLFVIIALNFSYSAQLLIGVHLLVKCALGAFLLALVILLSIDAPMRQIVSEVKLDKSITVLWVAVGVCQLISGIIVSVEYLPMAMIWLLELPVLFVVWSARGGCKRFFIEVAHAGNAVGVFSIAASVLVTPMDLAFYGGIFLNPNALSQWMTALLPIVLFLCCQEECGKVCKYAYIAEVASIALLCFVSKSRTGLLAVVAILTCFIALKMMPFLKKEKNVQRGWKRLAVKRVITIIIFSFIVAGGLLAANQVCSPALSRFFISSEVESSHINGSLLSSFGERLTGDDKHTDQLSLDGYSSGRIGIWAKVLESANLLGHPSRDHIITARNGDVGANAHNSILQVVYDNGVVAGALFACLMACALVQLLWRCFVEYNSVGSEESFALLVQIGFCCTSMFASINLPFHYFLSLLYLLSFTSLFGRKKSGSWISDKKRLALTR